MWSIDRRARNLRAHGEENHGRVLPFVAGSEVDLQAVATDHPGTQDFAVVSAHADRLALAAVIQCGAFAADAKAAACGLDPYPGIALHQPFGTQGVRLQQAAGGQCPGGLPADDFERVGDGMARQFLQWPFAQFEHVRAERFTSGDGACGDHIVTEHAHLGLQVACLAIGAAHAERHAAEQALPGVRQEDFRLRAGWQTGRRRRDLDASLQALFGQPFVEKAPGCFRDVRALAQRTASQAEKRGAERPAQEASAVSARA